MKYSKILETLQIQPLSEEEKTARHILGRLYGPIATCEEKTRNGRGYNRELWERALNDEVFKEKVANKSLFLELGHPQGEREETDMEKVCACIPELPKIVDGDLYAYVDILDTKNGRLLKTLCDYGFIPGISSRGSGDIMDNNDVDPETFFLETWDIVQLPAVKKARLAVCESLDTNKAKLNKVLVESLNKASKEDRALMQEALDNLEIEVATDDNNQKSFECHRCGHTWQQGTDKDISCPECEATAELCCETDSAPIILEEVAEEENIDDSQELEPTDEIEAAEIEDAESTETIKASEANDTVETVIGRLQNLDSNTPIRFSTATIDNVEYPINSVDMIETENGEFEIKVNCINEELPEEENPEVDIEFTEADFEEADDKAENTKSEDNDIETAELFKNLKEALRQNSELSSENKNLKRDATVHDIEVESLKESLAKYKNAFLRVSEVASNNSKFELEIKKLNEQIDFKNSQVKKLRESCHNVYVENENLKKQCESLKKNSETKLTEAYSNSQIAIENADKELTTYKTQLVKANKLAEAYKNKCAQIMEGYLESKASMLGVKVSDITNKLDENYSLADIDRVCDQILDSNISFSRLPIDSIKRNNIKINESVNKINKYDNPDNGYEIDDDLLVLAGLK